MVAVVLSASTPCLVVGGMEDGEVKTNNNSQLSSSPGEHKLKQSRHEHESDLQSDKVIFDKVSLLHSDTQG